MNLDKYLPYADHPTEKPEAGQWRLIAPSGREFAAPSPILCVQLEQKTRVPAHVGLGRIARMLNEPEADRPISATQPASPALELTDAELTAIGAKHLEAHAQFVGAGEVWVEGEVEFARAVIARDRALREHGR